jgi:hypothetical protein
MFSSTSVVELLSVRASFHYFPNSLTLKEVDYSPVGREGPATYPGQTVFVRDVRSVPMGFDSAILYVSGQAVVSIGSTGLGAIAGVAIVRSWNEIQLFQASIGLVVFLVVVIGGSLISYFAQHS